MQEPHKKGLASHLGPESCADGRKVVGEALTGEHAGQPLSSEITTSACRPCPDKGKATSGAALSELPPDAAESETLRMRESSRRENRETPGIPAPIRRGTAGEGHKPHVRHARSWGVGRSHSTDEAGEQRRPFGDSGVRGGKGIEQGDGPSIPLTPPRTLRRIGRVDLAEGPRPTACAAGASDPS